MIDDAVSGVADWVVVGAGSAGCVVTRRLLDAGRSVVLVEAGPTLPDPLPISVTGDDAFALHGDPRRVDVEVTARRTRDAPTRGYLRGRGLGGSSVVNAMLALECDPALPASWGWSRWSDAAGRVELPLTEADPAEFGVADRALLAADPFAHPTRLTRRDGRRVTSAEAYLGPVLSSASLTIRTDAPVDAIEVREGSAVGVRMPDGHVVEADRVALCAGAIGTPALLQRSAIGGEAVGTGLQDHPSVAVTVELADPTPPIGLATSVVSTRDPWQILPVNHLGHDSDGRHAVVMVALMRPVGRSGTVRVSAHGGAPLVDLDLLADPADRRMMMAGIDHLLSVVRSEPFREISSGIYLDDQGTPADRLVGADADAIESWMLAHVGDYVHASSSTAAVLGAAGAVAGVAGLFVADASAFPTIPDVNTHLPTTVLAELFVDRWLDERSAVPGP
ncbi:MAG: GMC family oxidoreductase [Actinomycetota bacterium]